MVSQLNIIPRDNVIPGARNDDFALDGEFLTDGLPKTHVVNVARADIHALNTTNLDIMPARPGGRRIAILGIYYDKLAGGYSGGAAITLHATGAGAPQVGSIAATEMRQSGARTGWGGIQNRTGVPADQETPEGGLRIQTSTAYTGAGGDLEITIYYLEASG